jgi:hypothetical protein
VAGFEWTLRSQRQDNSVAAFLSTQRRALDVVYALRYSQFVSEVPLELVPVLILYETGGTAIISAINFAAATSNATSASLEALAAFNTS